MTASRTRTWAYALTLAGGALILGGALVMILFYATLQGTGWSQTWWTPGHHEMFRAGFPFGGFVLLGTVAGAVVLWAGLRMKPDGKGEGTLEGVAAIVGSLLSFPVMGGFMFGALFGVLGGALSIAASAEGGT